MLGEALTALAAAGGTAVVQAAGSSLWQGLQQEVARWFGRGQESRERAVLERLGQSAAALDAAGDEDIARVRLGEQAVWQARFETALESLDDQEREVAARALRAILNARDAPRTVSAGDGGLAVGGDVSIHVDHGVAALQMRDVTLGNPPLPGPHQG